MIGVCPVLFLAYKIIRRTRFRSADEIDLLKDVGEMEEYQRTFVATPPR